MIKRHRRFDRRRNVRPVRCNDLQPIRDLFALELPTAGANDSKFFSRAEPETGYKSREIDRRDAEGTRYQCEAVNAP